MEQNPRHPLNSITNNNNMSMLEALIPFVDYPMKLPLALLIKANEIRLIIHAFHSLDYLSKIGLHNSSKDPIDMISSFTGMSPEMLKMMMAYAHNMGTDNNADLFSSFMGNPVSPDITSIFQNTPPQNPSAPDTSFDDRLQQILSEYDMEQAARFDESPPDSSSA